METGMLETDKTDEEPPNNGNIPVAKSEPDRRNAIARALSDSFLPFQSIAPVLSHERSMWIRGLNLARHRF